jgi:hypothetical protein
MSIAVIAGRARKVVKWPLRLLTDRVLVARKPRIQVCGITVIAAAERELAAQHLATVEGGLRIIQALDPRWLRPLRSNAHRIIIRHATTSFYRTASRTIILASHQMDRQPAEVVATMLVHEAVHARLMSLDVDGRDLLRRIEHACLKQQITFAKRLEGFEYLVEHLESFYDTDWWTPEARRTARREAMERTGAPPWMLKVHDRFSRPHRADGNDRLA